MSLPCGVEPTEGWDTIQTCVAEIWPLGSCVPVATIGLPEPSMPMGRAVSPWRWNQVVAACVFGSMRLTSVSAYAPPLVVVHPDAQMAVGVTTANRP